jgi:hypothetical protein
VPLSLRSDCGISLKRVPDRKPRDIERWYAKSMEKELWYENWWMKNPNRKSSRFRASWSSSHSNRSKKSSRLHRKSRFSCWCRDISCSFWVVRDVIWNIGRFECRTGQRNRAKEFWIQHVSQDSTCSNKSGGLLNTFEDES